MRTTLLKNLAPAAKSAALAALRALKVQDEHRSCWHTARTGIWADNYNCGLVQHHHYCRHGENVGNWATEDRMCWVCEDGLSDYEYALMVGYEHQRNVTKRMNKKLQDAALKFIHDESEMIKGLAEDQRLALIGQLLDVKV